MITKIGRNIAFDGSHMPDVARRDRSTPCSATSCLCCAPAWSHHHSASIRARPCHHCIPQQAGPHRRAVACLHANPRAGHQVQVRCTITHTVTKLCLHRSGQGTTVTECCHVMLAAPGCQSIKWWNIHWLCCSLCAGNYFKALI